MVLGVTVRAAESQGANGSACSSCRGETDAKDTILGDVLREDLFHQHLGTPALTVLTVLFF